MSLRSRLHGHGLRGLPRQPRRIRASQSPRHRYSDCIGRTVNKAVFSIAVGSCGGRSGNSSASETPCVCELAAFCWYKEGEDIQFAAMVVALLVLLECRLRVSLVRHLKFRAANHAELSLYMEMTSCRYRFAGGRGLCGAGDRASIGHGRRSSYRRAGSGALGVCGPGSLFAARKVTISAHVNTSACVTESVRLLD